MISKKNAAAILAIIFVGLSSVAAAGGDAYHGPVWHEPHAACVPKRLTYGYTPTTWRRWPTDGAAGSAKPAAEQLPTPAAQPLQSAPGTGPTIAPEETPLVPSDEAPLVPTDKGPGTPTPPDEAPLVPPFDEPPTPPKSSEPDAKPPASEPADAPPSTLPDPPEFPTHDSDPPPIKPDDDPFKDDPPSPADVPSKVPASGGAMGAGNPDATVRQTGSRSHVADLAREGASAGPRLMPANSLEEPRRLLQSAEVGAQEGHRVVPTAAPLKRNPLRSATQKDSEERIVPTAHWTADRSSSSAAAAPQRRNPLRSN